MFLRTLVRPGIKLLPKIGAGIAGLFGRNTLKTAAVVGGTAIAVDAVTFATDLPDSNITPRLAGGVSRTAGEISGQATEQFVEGSIRGAAAGAGLDLSEGGDGGFFIILGIIAVLVIMLAKR